MVFWVICLWHILWLHPMFTRIYVLGDFSDLSYDANIDPGSVIFVSILGWICGFCLDLCFAVFFSYALGDFSDLSCNVNIDTEPVIYVPMLLWIYVFFFRSLFFFTLKWNYFFLLFVLLGKSLQVCFNWRILRF